MKNVFSILLLGILLAHSIDAQKTDLVTLSEGKLVAFHALYDKDAKVFGYYMMYDKGIVSKNTSEFEFFILDKNLRQVLSNVVQGPVYVKYYYGALDENNDLLLYPYVSNEDKKMYKKLVIPTVYKVNMKVNKIIEWHGLCYENSQIVTCQPQGSYKDEEEKDKKEKKKNGFVKKSTVYEGDFPGNLVIEYDDYGKYTKNFTFRKFDESKNETWTYTLEDAASKKNYYFMRLVALDSNTIYGFKTFLKWDSYQSSFFMAWDMKTGKLLKNELITQVPAESVVSMMFLFAEGLGSKVDSQKSFDDKVVATGKIYKENYYNSPVYGYFRCIIDKQSHELKFDYLKFESDFKPYFPKITPEGQVEKGFKLSIRDVFFLKDGSLIYIFEKYTFDAGFLQGYSAQNDDLVFVITDASFHIKDVKVMDKEKSKYSASDYLFGQYLNDGKDFVFFYEDLKKETDEEEEKVVLFINTWINGTLNEEQFPISTKKNVIYPYIAKEGYILLREYNEKSKYNQIRLEKLNF